MINEFFENGDVANPCTKGCHDSLKDYTCPAITGEHYCPFFAGALRTLIAESSKKPTVVYHWGVPGSRTAKKFPNPNGLDFEVPGPGIKDAPLGTVEVRRDE